MLFSVYRDLMESGRLKLRICEQSLRQSPELILKYHGDGFRYGGDDHRLRITGIKLLDDGSLGARTAGLRRPYADDPSTCGLTIFTEEELDHLVGTAHDLGYPVLVHAIGDRAIEMVLDALERDRAKRPGGEVPGRHRPRADHGRGIAGPFPAAGCDGSRAACLY